MCCGFFVNDTATTEIYTLSLHDALPIFGDIRHNIADIGKIQRELGFQPRRDFSEGLAELAEWVAQQQAEDRVQEDRKSTRLNSSHANISYAVFCLHKYHLLLHKNNYPYF